MTVQDKIPTPTRAKLTVADFLLLAEAGAFERYARTELIEGEIWVVNAVHRRHARAHAMLTVELGIAIKAQVPSLLLYTAPSTQLSEISLPEPDIVVAEPSESKVLQGVAVRLAIEISDPTLDIDMRRKAELYARHRVPEYWVVDVEADAVHQMWTPTDTGYAERRSVPLGQPIELATIPNFVVATDTLKQSSPTSRAHVLQ